MYDGLLLQLLLLLLSLLQALPATLLLMRLSPAAGDAKRQTANGYMTTTCLHFVFCLPSSVCPVLMTKAAALQVSQCVRSCLRVCVRMCVCYVCDSNWLVSMSCRACVCAAFCIHFFHLLNVLERKRA